METFSEGLKKVMLAGIGAVATTAEKSSKLIDEMIEKGELTVEQGKALNKELKHTVENAKADKSEDKEDFDATDFVSKLTPEQLKSLKEQLDKTETK